MAKSIKKKKTTHAAAHDLATVEEKLDTLTEVVNETKEDVKIIKTKLSDLPTKADLYIFLGNATEMATLKKEHELMKKHMRDKLQVEI